MNQPIFSHHFAVVLTALLLSACTPTVTTQYVTAPLARPTRPELPSVKAQELECLSMPTYQKLYDRQRLITGYAKTLEAIIDSTKSEQSGEPPRQPDLQGEQ